MAADLTGAGGSGRIACVRFGAHAVFRCARPSAGPHRL